MENEKKMTCKPNGKCSVTVYFPAKLKWSVSCMVCRDGDDYGHISSMQVYAPTLHEAIKTAVCNIYQGSTSRVVAVYPIRAHLETDTDIVATNLLDIVSDYQ